MKSVTGWSDLVDDKISFVEVICDNYKALVEEKRKRMGRDNGGSKRHNTRNVRKEELGPPAPQKEEGETSMKPGRLSQPAWMEVDKKVKRRRY